MAKAFETYFDTKPVLSGPQPTAGDDLLVLRGGTVYKSNTVDNKAFASLYDNVTSTTITAQGTWVQVTGLTQGATTPTFTFANDAFTYVGPSQIVPANFFFNASLFYTVVDGAGLEIGVFNNGVLMTGGMRVDALDNVNKVCVACNVMANLTIGDVIDFRIRNRDNTGDVIVTDAHMGISQ